MDFAALRIFKAVVEEGSINGAARRLHRVQSNVSTRIQQLEASLGSPLFLRRSRRLFLSPAGEVFLGHVKTILDTWELARGALTDGSPAGVLRLGALESTAASRLPALMARFHRAWPSVRVELTTGTSDAIVEAVRAGKVDAAFVADFAGDGALDSVPAFREELVVIAHKSHAPIRGPRDVRGDSVISFALGCAYRRRLQAWLAAKAVVPAGVLEACSYHVIVAWVASGSGIAIVPASVLDTMRHPEHIARYPLGGGRGVSLTSMIWRRGERPLSVESLAAELGRPGK